MAKVLFLEKKSVYKSTMQIYSFYYRNICSSNIIMRKNICTYINIVLALIFAVYFDTFFRVINLLVFYFYRNLKNIKWGSNYKPNYFS